MNAQPVVDKKTFSVWHIIVVSIVSLIAGCALGVGDIFAMQDLGFIVHLHTHFRSNRRMLQLTFSQ